MFQKNVAIESRVEVYKFKFYDIQSDGYKYSQRMGTLAAIEMAGGIVDYESKMQVEASAVKSDIQGMTMLGFNP